VSTFRVHLMIAGLLLVGGFCQASQPALTPEDAPNAHWWLEYQIPGATSDPSSLQRRHETIGQGGYTGMGWEGVYQRVPSWDAVLDSLHDAGLKTRSFLCTIQAGEYKAQFDAAGTLVRTHWHGLDPDLPVVMYGFKQFYQDSPLWQGFPGDPRPSWSHYFESKWVFPDGRPVENPFDLAAANRKRQPYLWSRYNDGSAQTYMMDTANPQWQDYVIYRAKRLVDFGADMIHLDNFGGAEIFYPFNMAWGPYSVVAFPAYLKAHYTRDELERWGADSPDFDIVDYLNSRTLNDRNAAWCDDPIWSAYKLMKVAKRIEYNERLAREVRAYAEKKGRDVALVCNAGYAFPSDALAVACVDCAFYEYGWGASNVFLPRGPRHFGTVKLLRNCGNAPYSIMWAYPGKDNRHREGMFRWLYAESLAAGGVIYTDKGKGFDPPEGAVGDINSFILANRDLLRERRAYADAAVLFSHRSILAGVTISKCSDEPHTNDYYGWTLALDDLGYTYDAFLLEKLSAERLGDFPLAVLANAVALTPDQINMVTRYVENGGTLVVTGETSSRGDDLVRLEEYALAGLTGVRKGSDTELFSQQFGAGRVVYLAGHDGSDYFVGHPDPRRGKWGTGDIPAQQRNDRETALANIAKALERAGVPRRVTFEPADASVVLNVYTTSGDNPRTFVLHIVNESYDPTTDTVTPSPSLTIRVRTPDRSGGGAPKVMRAVSPEPAPVPIAAAKREGECLVVSVSPVVYYDLIAVTE